MEDRYVPLIHPAVKQRFAHHFTIPCRRFDELHRILSGPFGKYGRMMFENLPEDARIYWKNRGHSSFVDLHQKWIAWGDNEITSIFFASETDAILARLMVQ